MHDPVQLPPGRPIRIVGDELAVGRLRGAVAALPGRRLLTGDEETFFPGAVILVTADPAGDMEGMNVDLVYDARPYLQWSGNQAMAAGLLDTLLLAGPVFDDSRVLHGPEDFHRLPEGRPVCVYGAGAGGRIVRDALEAAGLAVSAFVDSRRDGQLDGLRVFSVEAFLNGAVRESTVVIASQAWLDIERTLIASGVTDAFNAHPIVRRHLWNEHWKRIHGHAGQAG